MSVKLIFWGGATRAVPDLSALSDPLSSTLISGTSDKPQVSFRFNTDGTIDEATGDTSAAFVYSQVGTWIDPDPPVNAADWEVRVTVNTEDVGDPGTWVGATRGAFNTLDVQRTYTWSKDDTTNGTAESEVTITLRQVSLTSNSAERSAMTYQGIISP